MIIGQNAKLDVAFRGQGLVPNRPQKRVACCKYKRWYWRISRQWLGSIHLKTIKYLSLCFPSEQNDTRNCWVIPGHQPPVFKKPWLIDTEIALAGLFNKVLKSPQIQI